MPFTHGQNVLPMWYVRTDDPSPVSSFIETPTCPTPRVDSKPKPKMRFGQQACPMPMRSCLSKKSSRGGCSFPTQRRKCAIRGEANSTGLQQIETRCRTRRKLCAEEPVEPIGATPTVPPTRHASPAVWPPPSRRVPNRQVGAPRSTASATRFPNAAIGLLRTASCCLGCWGPAAGDDAVAFFGVADLDRGGGGAEPENLAVALAFVDREA